MGRHREVEDYTQSSGIVEARLIRFGINSTTLRQQHINWLNDHVLPILSNGGSISLVGEASRSGSQPHNMTLSVNRAKSVLDYLRRRINGPLRYCDATQFTANSVSGVGESSAEAAGQRDGTEDSYYRAVRIRAWYRPNPPSPPECKSRTQPTVRRVISRTWNTVNTRMGGGGNPIHDGSAGALLGDLINKMIDVKKRGGSDTRRYHNYPTDYVIVRVYDEYTIDDHLYSGPVSTTTYKKVMRYEWGPRTLTVQLFKKQTIIHKGGTRRVTNTTESYSRDTIWEHTTAPDANVFG